MHINNKPKKLLMILISIILFAITLFAIGNNGVEAASANDIINGANNTTFTITSDIFKDYRVFCVETDQSIFTQGTSALTYTKVGEINITNDKSDPYNKVKQGLAYILSNMSTGNRDLNSHERLGDWYYYNDDPVQLAIRGYLYKYGNYQVGGTDENPILLKNWLHGNNNSVNVDDDNAWITDSGTGGTYGNLDTYHTTGKKAYEYYSIASDIANGDLSSNYSATIILLTNSGHQNLIVVKTAEESNPVFNLTINKTSTLGNAISGVTFRISLKNVASIKGYTENNTGMIYVTTKGTIEDIGLEITPEDINEKVVLTITEISVPDGNGYYYKKINGEIEIEAEYDNTSKQYDITVTKDSTVTDDEFQTSEEWVENDGENITINIKNQPLIDISGQVWLDGQIGGKDPQNINGEKDGSEEGINGVYVQLIDVSNNQVFSETYTETKDGIVGAYEFTQVPQTNAGYIVRFSYDGINYIETKAYADDAEKEDHGTASDANEDNRNDLRNRFKTISGGTISGGTSSGNATSEDGRTTTSLSYTNNSGTGEEKVTTTLNSNIDGTNPANSNQPDFRVSATTNPITTTTLDVDCGLVKKFFDISLGTDVSTVHLTINGKSTTYEYGEILKQEEEDRNLLAEFLDENVTTNSEIEYTQYLEESDYSFRVEDYVTDMNMNKDPVVNSYDISNRDEVNELEVYVTYCLILENQSTYGANVNQIAYYYDTNYELIGIGKEVDGTGRAIPSISIPEPETVENIGKQKIELSNFGGNLPEGNGSRQELYFTFKVIKDDNGGLPEEIGDGGLECANLAEIISYSTTDGDLIDVDSAPGNMIATNGAVRYEDDSDEAQGLTITLKEGGRTIEGTVWDDGEFNSADGTKQEPDEENGIVGESGVNDVIVQLIEIKYVLNKGYYEYIWQQTRSGSNEVNTINANGGFEDYTTDVNEPGKYKFTNFIPGNYIIRFIYGDGTTYDLTGNVQTYNGQDYKSTVDDHYNAPWYNTAGYTDGESVARDNEARRLEVMAYSSTIDETIGQSLENREEGDLRNTWMAAETSRINVPVDEDKDDGKATSSNTTTVEYENINNSLSFDNMNFGLALRPETKLILEKHITGLKITPNGTGVQSIIDAKADISQIINNPNISVSGVTTGLATIKSTRDNRGFWQIATDVEELAQGAQLEVEYTYVIRNDSEEDYLSGTLVELYEEGIGIIIDDENGNEYTQYYKDLNDLVENNIKRSMRNGTYSYSDSNVIGTYLGQFYYTGIRGENDTPVLSRVETIEEALNNDLKFDAKEGTSGNDFEEKETNEDEKVKTELNADGIGENTTIETVIQNTSVTDFLTRYTGDNADGTKNYHEDITDDNGNVTDANADFSKTVTLRTVLTSNSNGELGGNYQSYIAEIMQYSNAAGRRNMEAEPANLSYVNSEDTNVTLDNSWIYEIENGDGTTTKHTTQNESEIPENAINVRLANEADEFWGETIIITKPTGEDRLSALAITIIVISSIAVIAVGIVLIKKFVIKK